MSGCRHSSPLLSDGHKLAIKNRVTDTVGTEETLMAARHLYQNFDENRGQILDVALSIVPMVEPIEDARKLNHIHSSAGQLVRLATLCKALAIATGGRNWFLSCRDAGKFLGISHDRANDHLHKLEKAGFIERLDNWHTGDDGGWESGNIQMVNANQHG